LSRATVGKGWISALSAALALRAIANRGLWRAAANGVKPSRSVSPVAEGLLGTVRFILEDPEVPRSVFYDRLREALGRAAFDGPDLLVPAEDTTVEINWPRYGEPTYSRGAPPVLEPEAPFGRYLQKIATFAHRNPEARILVFNKHPGIRASVLFRRFRNIAIADGTLALYERTVNPRTVSLPSQPVTPPNGAVAQGPRPILASFQGADTHPVRRHLTRIDDGRHIVVRLVDPARHAGKIDADTGQVDAGYAELIDKSVFGFAPRGDCLFSYRLLELLGRGTIPIILSDGWVPPLDRTVDWTRFALIAHQEAITALPGVLKDFTFEEIEAMRAAGAAAYGRYFSDLDAIVAATLAEVQPLL
jgi:hypothetical protein